MSRRLLTAATALLFCVTGCSAQSGAAPSIPAPGDYWAYDLKDDISGTVSTTKDTVTDVANDEIAVRRESGKTGNTSNLLYDEFWNAKRFGNFKYVPNDGLGLRFPLTPDAQWEFSIDTTSLSNGQSWKHTGTSRVIGQEKISTKAGRFDTFVIESNFVSQSAASPARQQELTVRAWYSADINHWVKRSVVLRENGHVFRSDTMELTEYGKKSLSQPWRLGLRLSCALAAAILPFCRAGAR